MYILRHVPVPAPASVPFTGTPNGAKNDRQTTVTLSNNPSETIIGDDTHTNMAKNLRIYPVVPNWVAHGRTIRSQVWSP